MKKVILLTAFRGDVLYRLQRAFGDGVEFEVVDSVGALSAAVINSDTFLISFGTGVIVPNDILKKFSGPSYNLHAASPDFPGRDPHHHAVYRDAKYYGATLHVMEPLVDSGPIIGVEYFDVGPRASPQSLLDQANKAGIRLIERFAQRMISADPIPEMEGIRWGSVKTRRKDLLRLSRVSPLISADDFDRIYRAFGANNYRNLTLKLHGKIFRIDEGGGDLQINNSHFSDFTEASFRSLIVSLRDGGYRFARYGEQIEGRQVLWRHDVDFSMHRAEKLAKIEAQAGAVATYFVNPRCAFYNLLEPDILQICRRIISMGHEIGLHFDASAYESSKWERGDLESAVARERALLEMILDGPIRSLSWHNPDMSNLLDFDDETISGLHNAYAGNLRRDYIYCSDSNGYWRFRSMADVIAEGHERLHLLTHPGWWTSEPMAPSDRIDRAILGRARATRKHYDELLRAGNRVNLTE